EGYGPGGVAIMVSCATDNRNRTAGDVRSYFSKYGGNLGETGCVSWMFKERGEVSLERPIKLSDDDLMMLALELGADDVETGSEEYITIICAPSALEAVQSGLKKAGLEPDSAETVMSPISTAEVTDKDMAKQLIKLMDILEGHDDVMKLYANFEMDENWLSEFI
ncbi:MAG: YebC/PmpR family DNA-binding transcriptional regulator, partial [Candidatus Obscuribacterales bacterium]|nr:YebC/PmpR family DNA-binding transcriptional regulator [Candidatus Obscuribacterales bacterium]